MPKDRSSPVATAKPQAFPEHALLAQVARYFGVQPADVKRSVEHDGLPVIRYPMKTTTVARFPMRDLHAWILKRTKGETPHLSDFERWQADFFRRESQAAGTERRD